MKTNLTPEETSLLVDVLKEYLGDLRYEIRETDDFTFRKSLQAKEQTLSGIVARFEQDLVSGHE